VAIACQGGGSHTAFTAGVLQGLLDGPDGFDLVALSGTSGGAVCAALAWSGLISGAARPRAEAIRRLGAFWDDLKADSPLDSVLNFWGVLFARLPVVAEVSPYSYAPYAESELRTLLARHVDFDRLPPQAARRRRPYLFVGATDVLNGIDGTNSVFHGETLQLEEVVASAAIPPVFRAIAAGGSYYWDGLFSRNPPIREFTDLAARERPDEIWVIRINPRRRERVPVAVPEIVDRRNELAGNLALDQEIAFIEKINALRLESAELGRRYKHIAVRQVELAEGDLDYPSKLDRTPAFIDRLLRAGRAAAAGLPAA